MAYKGVIEDFQKIRENKIPSRVPCLSNSEEFDVRWHEKYTYEEFCQDGDKIFEVYKAAIERFDYDWAWVQIDDCFEFEPIGVKVKGKDNILRATYEYLPVSLYPIKVLWKGTPETIEAEVERIMGVCKEGGGFAFYTGEMVPRFVPEENMDAFMSSARKLAAY
ncbi:MAG TPA: hypothetical protein ENI20_11500 [Bacteroides sp.]|nr:hypothetical protein [Bacteroides sp.]